MPAGNIASCFALIWVVLLKSWMLLATSPRSSGAQLAGLARNLPSGPHASISAYRPKPKVRPPQPLMFHGFGWWVPVPVVQDKGLVDLLHFACGAQNRTWGVAVIELRNDFDASVKAGILLMNPGACKLKLMHLGPREERSTPPLKQVLDPPTRPEVEDAPRTPSPRNSAVDRLPVR